MYSYRGHFLNSCVLLSRRRFLVSALLFEIGHPLLLYISFQSHLSLRASHRTSVPRSCAEHDTGTDSQASLISISSVAGAFFHWSAPVQSCTCICSVGPLGRCVRNTHACPRTGSATLGPTVQVTSRGSAVYHIFIVDAGSAFRWGGSFRAPAL